MREILVVKRDILFKDEEFRGQISFEEKNFISIILNNYKYQERNDALENNQDILQIIPYVWILNRKEKKLFLYKRAPSKGDYKEKRHLNNYSGGVGGHVDKDTEENSKDPIHDAMMRELREEVIMQNYPNPDYFGYIYTDLTMFDKVHLGIVAVAETEEKPNPSDGMSTGDFYSVDEVEKLLLDPRNKFDNWTRLGWSKIKEDLLSSN